MRRTISPRLLAAACLGHARRTGRLISLISLTALAPAALAEVVVDPFNEGNTAVADFVYGPDDPYFFGLMVGVERFEDEDPRNSGTPGFGDILFTGGDQHELDHLSTSYIGVNSGPGEPVSRGRVFVDQGTELRAVGGLRIQGDGSVLSITEGAEVFSLYGTYMTDSYEGSGTAQFIVSGPGSHFVDWPIELAGGRLMIESGVGETKVLVSDGGHVDIAGLDNQEWYPDSLSLIDVSADFEVSGAGSIVETDHRMQLKTGEGESARVLDGGLILQTHDFSDTLERPIAFSYNGGTDETSGLLVAGFGSRIDLVNDALLGDSAYVTLRDGGSLNTEGSVYIEAASPGATKVVLDRGWINAGDAVVVDDGAEVLAMNGSTIGGDVEVNGGTLTAERSGLSIAGDLAIDGGTLALEVTPASSSKEFSRSALAMSAGQQPALVVEGNVLFGPDSFIRLLLSAVPNGDILVDDYLLADAIDFAPQFSLAAALDIQFDSDVDLSDGAEFSVRFAALDQTVAYRYNAVKVPEIDGSGLPLVAGLLLSLIALRRERRR